MAELLPCPFCGGEARVFQNTQSDYQAYWYWTVECTNQKCNAELGFTDTEEESIAAWNTRQSVPVGALEQLRQTVAGVCESWENDADEQRDKPGYREYPAAVDYLRGQKSTAKSIRIAACDAFRQLIDQHTGEVGDD